MRKYHPTGPQPRIPVWGPEGTADRMARAYDLPLAPGMHEEFDFRVWEGPVQVGPFAVEPFPGVLSTEILPPIRSTSCCEIASPSPVPPSDRLRPGSTR